MLGPQFALSFWRPTVHPPKKLAQGVFVVQQVQISGVERVDERLEARALLLGFVHWAMYRKHSTVPHSSREQAQNLMPLPGGLELLRSACHSATCIQP